MIFLTVLAVLWVGRVLTHQMGRHYGPESFHLKRGEMSSNVAHNEPTTELRFTESRVVYDPSDAKLQSLITKQTAVSISNNKDQIPRNVPLRTHETHQKNLKSKDRAIRAHSVKQGKSQTSSSDDKKNPFAESLHNTVSVTLDNNGIGLNLMQSYARNNITFVVFVQRGYSLGQFEYIVELASKFNPVIVITDLALPATSVKKKKSNPDQNYTASTTDINIRHSQPVFTVQFGQVEMNNTALFSKIYKSINLKADSPTRQEYEKLCIQRWIYVSNLCTIFNISHIFYADSDVAIFSNLTTAFIERNRNNRNCDAEISLCGLLNDNALATASGHSSFWSAAALLDLTSFITQLYSEPYISSLYHYAPYGSKITNRVTDMTVLFTYWIAHHMNDSYIDAGMPQYLYQTWSHENKPREQWAQMIKKQQIHFNSKIDFARNLSWPVVNTQLKVCNILDTPEKSSFDHIQLYENRYFSLNLGGPKNYSSINTTSSEADYLLPYILSDVLANNLGGQGSKNKHHADVSVTIGDKTRKMYRVYSHTVHYQSTGKRFVPVDVCRRLLSRSHLQQLLISYGNCDVSDIVCLKERDEMRYLLSEPTTTISAMKSKDQHIKSVNEFLLSSIVSTRVAKTCRDVLTGNVQNEKYV